MRDERTDDKRPLARRDRLLEESVGDEIVVFDVDTNEAHCLKPVAAAVYRHADGHRTIAALAEQVSLDLGETVDAEAIGHAVAQLQERNLVARPTPSGGISRRDIVRAAAAAGGAALAAPLVVTIDAPLAASAASCAAFMCMSSGSTGRAECAAQAMDCTNCDNGGMGSLICQP